MEKTEFFVDVDHDSAALISTATKIFINQQCSRSVIGVPGMVRYVFNSVEVAISLFGKLDAENILFECWVHTIGQDTLHQFSSSAYLHHNKS